MQTFTLNPARYRTVRAFGRNPLVRASDRIQAMALVLTIAIALIALPVAGALGTSVYDQRSREYAEQALTRHKVTATVLSDSTPAGGPDSDSVLVHAHWLEHGVEHANTFTWGRSVKAGDRIDIWTDDHGNRVDPAPPTSRAAVDAVCTGVDFWLCVVLGTAAVFLLVSWWLSCLREARWDREFKDLVDDGGGWASG